MALRMIAGFLDELDNLAVELLVYGGWLIAGFLLIDAGIQHLLSPLSATAADWLATYLPLQVTALGLSIGGLLNLVVRFLGLVVLANGVGYVLLVGQRLFLLGQQMVE